VFLLRRPTDERIERTVKSQRDERLTYSAVGLTRESRCPDGYVANERRTVIGQGEDTFRRAKQAIADLRMLKLGWIDVFAAPDAFHSGDLIATLVWELGLYSLNVARIVYVENEDARFGFGYGTLPEYSLSGEERFSVTLDRSTGEVAYELYSFSRPSTLLARLGWPMVRIQARFAKDSAAAMRAACEG